MIVDYEGGCVYVWVGMWCESVVVIGLLMIGFGLGIIVFGEVLGDLGRMV